MNTNAKEKQLVPLIISTKKVKPTHISIQRHLKNQTLCSKSNKNRKTEHPTNERTRTQYSLPVKFSQKGRNPEKVWSWSTQSCGWTQPCNSMVFVLAKTLPWLTCQNRRRENVCSSSFCYTEIYSYWFIHEFDPYRNARIWNLILYIIIITKNNHHKNPKFTIIQKTGREDGTDIKRALRISAIKDYNFTMFCNLRYQKLLTLWWPLV